MAGSYGTARWQRLRQQQLQCEPLCAYCLKDGKTTPATIADHIIPHKGNEAAFWDNELQSLCKRYENESPHHAIAMREQARRFEALAEELGQGLHISMEA